MSSSRLRVPGRTSAPTRAPSRRAGFALLVGMVALMWAEEVVDLVGQFHLDRYGIEPRDLDRLIGIVTAPFLHAGFGHLVSNTLPFLVLGFLVALGGALRLIVVTVIVAVVGGLGTWLFAPPDSIHIGASGVVFGYAGYLLSRGFFTRRIRDFVLAAVILAIWGGALLTSLMPAAGISWQGHLFGALGGLAAGRVLARPPDRGGAIVDPRGRTPLLRAQR